MSIQAGNGISIPFIPKNNFEATAAPTVNDDTTKGYSKGSRWIFGGNHYVLTDATEGAAVWERTEQNGDPLGSGDIGTLVQAWDADLDALSNLSGTGYVVRIGTETYTERTITGTTNQVNVTNGDGVAGNTVLSLPQDIHTGASPTFADLTAGGLEVPHRLVHASTTGLHDGGVLSINVDNTKFDISAGEGHIVDNFTDPELATLTEVPWTAFTAQTVTGLATQDRTYIAIDINGDIVQQATPFTAEQFRDHIFIGLLDHPNRINIDLVFPLGALGYDTGAQLQDVILALGIINVSGNVYNAASTDLTLARSAGEVFRQGSNYDGTAAGRKNPNFVTSSSESPVTFRYRYQDGAGGWTEGANTTNIVPGSYDDGDGTLGTVANNKWSIQRIYYIDDTAPTTRILYGQFTYASLAGAEAALSGEAVNIDPDLLANYSLRGWLIVKGNATDLSDTSTAKFITADKFGLVTSGGGTTATTDLQTAYNNSPDPEIILATALGGVSITDASTPIGVDLFEIQDFARTTDYFKVDVNGAAATAITIDNISIDGNDITSTSGNINITPASGSAINFDGAATFDNGLFDGTTLQLFSRIGTAASPSYTFSIDPNTGIYRPASDQIGLSCGGTNVATFTGTSTTLTEPVTITDTTDATSASTGSLILDGGLGLDKTIYSGDTTESTDDTTGSIITPGGIGATKNIYSGGLISNNPWEFVGSATGTMGSTDATVSVTVSGYKTYRIYVRGESVANDVVYVRVILNGVLTSSTYESFYVLANSNNIDAAVQGINIGGLTTNTTIDSCGFWMSDIIAPNGTGGEFYVRNHNGFYYQNTNFGARMEGGTWNQGSTADVASIGIKIYDAIESNTTIGSDVIDISLWVFGSTLENGAPWT